MNPVMRYYSRGPVVQLYKINQFGFKEIITVAEGFESAMTKQGYKLYNKGKRN